MPCKAVDIVRKAQSFIGTHEDPIGSNNVVFNTDYYGQPVSGDDYAWCAAFIWDLFRLCGASELYYDGKHTAYCPTLQSWGKKSGLVLPDVHAAQPGDIVLFDWTGNKTANHVGICETATPSAITTIEGNTADSVKRMTRDYSQVCAVLRPAYDPDTLYPSDCANCPLRSALIELYTIMKEECEK